MATLVLVNSGVPKDWTQRVVASGDLDEKWTALLGRRVWRNPMTGETFVEVGEMATFRRAYLFKDDIEDPKEAQRIDEERDEQIRALGGVKLVAYDPESDAVKESQVAWIEAP